MRNLKLSAILIACAATAQLVSAQPKEDFDFKGVPLEIPYDEFRQLPHPDGTENAKVMCTGEKVQVTNTYSSEPIEVMVFDETEKELGIKKCIWVSATADPQRYRRAGEVLPLKLAGSGYVAYDYSFSFLPDPEDGVPKLFRFQGESNHNAASDVVQALTEKWGQPVITNDNVQNKMGAIFDQTTAIWSKSGSSIVVRDRWLKIDKMMIMMSNQRLVDVVAEAEKARKAKIPNPI